MKLLLYCRYHPLASRPSLGILRISTTSAAICGFSTILSFDATEEVKHQVGWDGCRICISRRNI
ncbi:hypothetical protein BGX38DRAFT_1153564 [Terfezia claveryi]|nr:hypothetical protein BGX38DRAFT_1153564 [Terfezia claveryi]